MDIKQHILLIGKSGKKERDYFSWSNLAFSSLMKQSCHSCEGAVCKDSVGFECSVKVC